MQCIEKIFPARKKKKILDQNGVSKKQCLLTILSVEIEIYYEVFFHWVGSMI